jgi:hypothetical protein
MHNFALFLLASTVQSAVITLQTPDICKENADGTFFDSIRLSCIACPVNTEPAEDCKYTESIYCLFFQINLAPAKVDTFEMK